MRNKSIFGLIIITCLLFVALLAPMQYQASAAPAAAPTPVAGVINQSSNDPQLFIFSNPVTITADTRTCLDTSRFDVLDIEYAVNQSSINTMTVKLQYTNRGQRYADGASVLSANTTDTAGMQQFPVFGRMTCVLFDVTNSNGVSVSVTGLGK